RTSLTAGNWALWLATVTLTPHVCQASRRSCRAAWERSRQRPKTNPIARSCCGVGLSLYLKVLRTACSSIYVLLCRSMYLRCTCDVLADRPLAHIARRAEKETARPQRGQSLKLRKFVAPIARATPLDKPGNIRGQRAGMSPEEEVDMIGLN